MTITRNINGSITLATMHNGFIVRHTFYGYSVKEAVPLFRLMLREGRA